MKEGLHMISMDVHSHREETEHGLKKRNFQRNTGRLQLYFQQKFIDFLFNSKAINPHFDYRRLSFTYNDVYDGLTDCQAHDEDNPLTANLTEKLAKCVLYVITGKKGHQKI